MDSIEAGSTLEIGGSAAARLSSVPVKLALVTAIAIGATIDTVVHSDKPSDEYIFVHGTSDIFGIDQGNIEARGRGDFGFGFYTFKADDPGAKEMASDRARQTSSSVGGNPILIYISMKAKDYMQLHRVEVYPGSQDWNVATWLYHNRRGPDGMPGYYDHPTKSDVLIGPLRMGGWRDEPQLDKPYQYVFRTPNAFSKITSAWEEEVY